jgi:tripartite motif-containing protein 2/3
MQVSLLSEVLECYLCFQLYDDGSHAPRLLSCGHSFCSRCLERLFRNERQAQVCPIDKILIEARGLIDIPKNFALLDLINSESALVSPCQLCVSRIASHRCMECDESMCDQCRDIHLRSKLSRDHKVAPLSRSAASDILSCCDHLGETCNYYDFYCDKFICAVCAANNHKDHRFETLVEAAAEYRGQLEVLSTATSKCASDIEESLRRIADISQLLDKNCQSAVDCVRDAFGELRAELLRREQSLVEELFAAHSHKTLALARQKDKLKQVHICLRSMCARADVLLQSPPGVPQLLSAYTLTPSLWAINAQVFGLKPCKNPALACHLDPARLLATLPALGVVSTEDCRFPACTAAGTGLSAIYDVSADPFPRFVITTRDFQVSMTCA